MLDDLGVADLGAYGGSLAPTPHLDALAADGLRFTNAYANGPVCSPTRAALLTGRHPVSFGIRRAIVNESVRGIPADVATLPAVLGDAGYATGHFGKWHLGWNRPDHLPSAKGYDEAVLVASDPPDYHDPAFLIDGTDPIEGEGHLTAATVDFAIDFISRHRDGPFFVNVWLNAPHTPLDPPAEWAARFPDERKGRYAALIADADEEIGRLVEAIDELGIAGETIVIVTSDNGGTHPEFGSNGDYRGDKTSLFEGALRVPMILRWPGRVPAGSVTDALVLSWDLFPTIAALADIDPGDLLEGRSFAGVLEGATLPVLDGPVVWENKFSNDVFSSPSGLLDNYAVRDGSWKLIFDDNDVATQPLLFDLATDPFETSDVAAEHPEVVARLQQVYLDWRLVTGRISTSFDDAALDLSVPVRIDDDGRLDTHDGDFTFRAVVNVDGLPDEETPIASKEGSWSLWLTTEGAVRLEVTGSDAVPYEVRSDALPTGPMPVAFTIYGRRSAPATVTLFVGDESIGETTGPPMIYPGRTPLTVGSPAASGSISGLYLSQTALYVSELAEITRREGS
jgi:arylsulfatase A-like enzyme